MNQATGFDANKILYEMGLDQAVLYQTTYLLSAGCKLSWRNGADDEEDGFGNEDLEELRALVMGSKDKGSS